MEQPTLMTVPTKRQAPLRKIEKQRIGSGGPHGGKRLYFFLDCGHVQERMLKAAFDSLERAHCLQCIGLPANCNELAVRQEHAQ